MPRLTTEANIAGQQLKIFINRGSNPREYYGPLSVSPEDARAEDRLMTT